MKTKKGKRFITNKGLRDLFDKEKAYFATARVPLAHPIRAFFYIGGLKAYIDYLEFSPSQ